MPIDYTKYPPNWKSEIRPRILERENHCCKDCGVKNYSLGVRDNDGSFKEVQDVKRGEFIDYYGQSLKVIKIVLTIAHLDHDEENMDVEDERLAALCQKCHLNYDKEEKARRREVKLNN